MSEPHPARSPEREDKRTLLQKLVEFIHPGPDSAEELIETLAEAESALAADREAYASGQLLKLGMYRRDNDELIGMVQLFNLEDASRRGEIGYCLARVAQGRGYMDEALTCFIDYLHNTLHLRRLEAEIDPRNQGSARTLERQGFVLEGTLRARWCVAGELSDSGMYGLLLEPPVA